MTAKSPRRLIQRLLRTRRSTSDDTSVSDPRKQRMDEQPPDSSTTTQADAPPTPTWSDVGAERVPKSHAHGSEPVQLPESRAEPGGPPVYADPNMVTPAAAEKMRPLFRRSR